MKDSSDYREFFVKVRTSDVNTAASALPTSINNISIQIIEDYDHHMDDHRSNHCECETTAYNCVPGGANLNCPSSGCIVRYGDNEERYMCTTAHQFDDYCHSNINGEPVYVGENGSIWVGSVVDFDEKHDVAIFDDSMEADGFDNTILTGYTNNPVVGHWTEWRVDDAINNQTTVENHGATTCTTFDHLTDKYHEFNDTCQKSAVPVWIESTAEAAGGDSGSPHYYNDTELGLIRMIGLHKSHTDSDGNHERSKMSAAFSIYEDADIDLAGFGSYSDSC